MIKEKDITLTLVRWRYPRKLFKWFRKKGFLITDYSVALKAPVRKTGNQ